MTFSVNTRDSCIQFLHSIEPEKSLYMAHRPLGIEKVTQEKFNELSFKEKKYLYRDLEVVISTFTGKIPKDCVDALKKVRALYNKIKPPLLKIHRDVLQNILVPLLDLDRLKALSFVNKEMYARLSKKLWVKRRSLFTFGPKQWKSLGYEVENPPSLPKDIDTILQSNCPYYEGKKVFQTHKLMLLQAGIDETDIHYRALSASQGFRDEVLPLIFGKITQDFKSKKVIKPYWALVTMDVIPSSNDLRAIFQQKLIKKGYQPPTCQNTITLITLNKMKRYTLPKYPNTKTENLEHLNGSRMHVKNFYHSSFGRGLKGFHVYDTDGILAVRPL